MIGARLLRFALLVGARNREDLLALAEPVREHDRAADHLIRVLGIDTEAKRQFDRLVELRKLHLLHQGNGLFNRVRTLRNRLSGRGKLFSARHLLSPVVQAIAVLAISHSYVIRARAV